MDFRKVVFFLTIYYLSCSFGKEFIVDVSPPLVVFNENKRDISSVVNGTSNSTVNGTIDQCSMCDGDLMPDEFVVQFNTTCNFIDAYISGGGFNCTSSETDFARQFCCANYVGQESCLCEAYGDLKPDVYVGAFQTTCDNIDVFVGAGGWNCTHQPETYLARSYCCENYIESCMCDGNLNPDAYIPEINNTCRFMDAYISSGQFACNATETELARSYCCEIVNGTSNSTGNETIDEYLITTTMLEPDWVLLENIKMLCPTGTIDVVSNTMDECKLVCEDDISCNFISFNDDYSSCYLCPDMPTVECSSCIVQRLDRDNCPGSFIHSNERVVFFEKIDHGTQEVIECSDYTNHDDGWYGSIVIGCQDGKINFEDGECHHWETLIHSGSEICSNANEVINVNHIRECREHCVNDENCDHITYADNEVHKICILCDQVPDQDSSYYCSKGSCEVQKLTTKWNKQSYKAMDIMTCSPISTTNSTLNAKKCQQKCYSNSACHHSIFSDNENSVGDCFICSEELTEEIICPFNCISHTFDKTICENDENCDNEEFCFNGQCQVRSTEDQPCDDFGVQYPKCAESFVCVTESEENELKSCQAFDGLNARNECFSRNNVAGQIQTEKFVWCEPKLECIFWTDVCSMSVEIDSGSFAEQYFMIMLPILLLFIMRVMCIN